MADLDMVATLKAWQVDDRSTYAGRDADEAIRAAMADTGHAREDFDDEPDEVDPATVVSSEDEPWVKATVGEILAGMVGPGAICWTDC